MRTPRWAVDWRLWLTVALAGLVAVFAVVFLDAARGRSRALDAIAARDRQLAMLRRQLADRDAIAAAERARLNERVDQLVAQLQGAGIAPAPETPSSPPQGSSTTIIVPPATTTTSHPSPSSTTTTTRATTSTTQPPCTTLPITARCV